MLTDFHLSLLGCKSNVHCEACRTSSTFRESVTGMAEFDCPFPGKVFTPSPEGYGTKLERLMKAKYKVESCGACFHRIEEMNQMTLEEAVAAKKDILEDIWTRRDQTKGLRKLASRLPGAKHLAFYELGKLYDEALKETQ